MSTDSRHPAAPSFPSEDAIPVAPPIFLRLLLLACCALALVFAIDVCLLLVTGKGAERRDFISYWASGQQLAHHQNPYDAAAILQLERASGFPPGGEALIVRNPPSALPLVAPLGFLGFRAAAVVWSLMLVGCWAASIRILSVSQRGSPQAFDIFGYRVSPTFICLLFGPALACVLFGQTGLFALFGFVLFLRLQRSHPFAAGLSLWLCALKPHLFLLVAVTLLLWILVTRSYRVLAGAAIALGLGSLLSYLLDPSAWAQYAVTMRGVGIGREFIPCLGIALRFAIKPESLWLQYIPALLGSIWAVRYYWTRRHAWDWQQHGPLLLLVSMIASPYAWLTDQVLAIPALLLVSRRANFSQLLTLALVSAAIEIAILCGIYMHSAFYLWTAPAWLAWYLFVQRSGHPSPKSASQ